MDHELETIRTKGKKEVPQGTKLEMRLGQIPGSVTVKIQLPGQLRPIEIGNLMIKDKAIELPVNLVFLSHAKEDAEVVAELSGRLLQDGIITWFDEKDLHPGDNWKLKINEGIDKSDYALVFLSKKSVNKEGYFQKELKTVLERYEMMPANARFIIPILLDACEPPASFKEISWLRMESRNWYEKLVRAIQER